MEGTTKEEGDEKNSETVPPNVAKLEAKRGNGTRNCFLVLYRTPPPERRSFLLIKWSQWLLFNSYIVRYFHILYLYAKDSEDYVFLALYARRSTLRDRLLIRLQHQKLIDCICCAQLIWN